MKYQIFSVVIYLFIIPNYLQFLVSSDNINNVSPLQTLELVQVIHRHGDRTPEEPFPNDQNFKKIEEIGYGELTNDGKRSQYELGKYLRRRYDEFLGPYYHKKYSRSRSSDYDRTFMSASCVLAALYSPVDQQIWNEDIKWQPIPISTVPRNIDFMLATSAECNLRRFITTHAKIDLNKENQDFYHFLTAMTGSKITDGDDVRPIIDAIEFAEKMNWTIPIWVTEEVKRKMNNLNDQVFNLHTPNKKSQILLTGTLLKEIVQNLNNKTIYRQTDEKKINLYATHDVVIAGFMKLLEIYNGIRPPVNSAVIFELYSDINDSYNVQILYRNDTTTAPIALRIPNCTELCPWEKFSKFTKPLIPENIIEECKILKTVQSIQQTGKPSGLIFTLGIVATVMTVVIGMTALYVWKVKTEKTSGYSSLPQL